MLLLHTLASDCYPSDSQSISCTPSSPTRTHFPDCVLIIISVVVIAAGLHPGLPVDRHLAHLLGGGGMRPLPVVRSWDLADFPEFRYDNPAGSNDRAGSESSQAKTPTRCRSLHLRRRSQAAADDHRVRQHRILLGHLVQPMFALRLPSNGRSVSSAQASAAAQPSDD